MVGLLQCIRFYDSTYRDTRFWQILNKCKVSHRIYLKKIPESYFKEIHYFFLGGLPLDSLLLVNQFSNITFNLSSLDKTNCSSLSLSRLSYYWFVTFLRFELSFIFTPIDISLFKSDRYYKVSSVFSCLFFNKFLTVHLNIVENTLQTLSYIFSSLTWVERELCEFNSFFFTGLRDSRRLLSDYSYFSEDSRASNSYNTNSYNNILQDLMYI